MCCLLEKESRWITIKKLCFQVKRDVPIVCPCLFFRLCKNPFIWWFPAPMPKRKTSIILCLKKLTLTNVSFKHLCHLNFCMWIYKYICVVLNPPKHTCLYKFDSTKFVCKRARASTNLIPQNLYNLSISYWYYQMREFSSSIHLLFVTMFLNCFFFLKYI